MVRRKKSRSSKHTRYQARPTSDTPVRSSTQLPDIHIGVADFDGRGGDLTIELNKEIFNVWEARTSGSKDALRPYPLNPNGWFLRALLSDKQALLAFGAFGTYHIGFQNEKHWNTNLRYTYPAKDIFNYIAQNKGDDSIPDEYCIAVIEVLQELLVEFQRQAGLLASCTLLPEPMQEVATQLFLMFPDIRSPKIASALSGEFARKGYSQKDVETLFRLVYGTEEAELQGRLADVASTFERFKQGEGVLGIEVLRKERLLSDEQIGRLTELLCQEP